MKSTLPTDARLTKILKILHQNYGDTRCSLEFCDPFQLLVATILSAQCTDARVNQVTPSLFAKFPSPSALASAPLQEIEALIRSTGFYRNKARNLQAMARSLVEKFGGEVPKNMADLSALSGVGRKTANVVLGNAFGQADGVVVDTHVKRLSFRLGLTKKTLPEQVERELNVKIPKNYWVELPHWLIQHGRRICIARSPRCGVCPLEKLCPKKGISKPQLAKAMKAA